MVIGAVILHFWSTVKAEASSVMCLRVTVLEGDCASSRLGRRIYKAVMNTVFINALVINTLVINARVATNPF